MKRTIISLMAVVMLIAMTLPVVSPSPVAAGKTSVEFTQYANVDDQWIGSILQKSNSMYYECMSVPQRTILDDIAPTTDGEHTFTFSHQATKGGTHAYDWLTAYNQGNEPPLAFEPCGEKISTDFAAICENLHTSGYSVPVDVPDDPFISKDGSTQDRIDAYEGEFGNRQIKIYGNEPIAAAGLTLSHDVSNNSDTGDSYINYVLTWTSNSTQIIIEMAGHLAMSGDPATNPIAWGPGLGASQISGGPYHFKLSQLDEKALGSQDNQIKGADILEVKGTIIAHKFNDLNSNGTQESGEDDLEGWAMTLYEGSNCTGDLLASGTTDINGDVVFGGLGAGTYSVKETLKGGWTNSTALCQQATISGGESVTLDFGNVELIPDIDVEKTASPDSGAASTNVTFTITVENTGDLTLNTVEVVDTIPAGMSYVSDDAGGTESPEGTITWDIGSMAPGDATLIHLVAHIDGDELGFLTNSVTATGTPTYGDDVQDTDTAHVYVYHAGIDVQKTADPTCGAASTNVTFAITVTNTNGSVLDPVIVVDTLPDGMSYISDDRGGAELPEGTITWDIGSLASGNSTTIRLVASIDGDELGPLTNEVTATGTPPEGDDVEDSDTADVLAIDAKISMSPLEDTNVVGDEHVLTAKVEVDDGTGWEPYEGATVTFDVTSGPGDLDPVSTMTDVNGEATTTLTTTEAGNSTVTASASICGYDFFTDGEAPNSDPAEKEWVYARIRIDPPEDTNVVGDSHDFTATVETSTDGIDWDPYEGATIAFDVTSGPGDLDPVTDVTDTNGEARTTLTSAETGTSTVKASTSIYGYYLSTDGTGESSEPAEKDWVYARIRITPQDDTNVVGDPHELTATVETSTDGIAWDPYQGANITFEVTGGPGTLDPESALTDSNGEAKTTLSSNSTGTTTVNASTKVYDWALSTDGIGENSDPAEKDWVYARIRITPQDDTNVVGDSHEFTATVETSTDGTDWDPYQGADITFKLTSGPGDLDPVTDVTDVNGEAVTILTTTIAGTSVVEASTSVHGHDLSTDGIGENSDPAEKDWVYARIKIDPPDDTNVVGDSHEFTATVETSTNNITWDPYEGATVTFEKTEGPGDLDPVTDVTDTNGQAKTTLTSTETGTTTVKASTTVYGFDLSTDGEVNNSDPAEKDWVYARIKIDPPDDINLVGDPHEFTATVETSVNGTDWDPYEGAVVVFEVTSGPGTLDPLSALTDVNGEAVTTLTSTITGTTTVKASTTVYGHDLSTDGDAYNSDPADKEWVDARISIFESGVNPVGQPHDFTVTVEKYVNESTGWIAAAGVNVTGTTTFGILTGSPATTNSEGQVTFTVNSNVAGTAIVHAEATVSICDIDIAVATNGYGAYDVDNTKTWTTPPTPPTGGGGCPTTKYLTVDWEGENTTEPLYSNDKLAVNLLGPSPNAIHNLFLERGTHAPVVGRHTYYLIVIRELEDIPELPENTTALMAFNITPADAAFNRDIFLTLGIPEVPENALNVTMAYYDDVEGAWVLLDSEAGGPSGVAELTLSAPINHFSIFGVLAELEPTPPSAPANFVGTGLSIEPSVEKNIFVTKWGESVTITFNLENKGGQAGPYPVALKLNGETVATQTVTLNPGESKQLSFTVSDLDYGQYEVEVGGLDGEFTTSRTIAWWLIVVIIVGVGLIIWGVVWSRRRRRATQQEA